MKERETFPGKTYAVTSPNGCTVTTEDGLTLAEIEAGKQGYFVAVSGKVLLSDDSAILTQLFKLAPQQRLAILGVLGGNGGLPAWFKALKTELAALLDGSQFELAWLADENTLVVHTDRVSDELSDAVTALLERVLPQNIEVVQYNHYIELTYDEYMKYSKCKYTSDMYKINPDYNNDVTESGAWAYNLDLLIEASSWDGGRNDVLFKNASAVKKVLMSLPAMKSSKWSVCTMVQNMENLEELEFSMPQGIHFRTFHTLPKLKKARLHLPNAEVVYELFMKCPKLEDFEISPNLDKVKDGNSIGNGSKGVKRWSIPLPLVERLDWAFSYVDVFEVELPRVTSMYLAFSSSKLDKASVLRILNSIPADPVTLDATNTYKGYSPGKATLGIHVDHQYDEEVLAAIASAEAKGWTLTVQWNGTPTAQATTTYGLRKPPIYARLIEENGERYLDWGHYVTDPSWYEEFRSVEAAREYFGLPDEDLTETE